MPLGTSFKLNGRSSQVFNGAIYATKGAVIYAGDSGTSTDCTQLIGDTVTFTGNSNFAINCGNRGTRPVGILTAKLVE